MIKINKLSKDYNGNHVLCDVSIKLPNKGLVIIEGPSGCGKTTLLNCLSGLIDFNGDIEIDNKHIKMMNEKSLGDFRLKNMGFIFQDYKLFEDENVINNIMLPLDAIGSSNKDNKIRKCLELINLVGLKKNYKQKVSKLSGGEKQRVAIARALVNNPKIILADEPTGSLDYNTANEIMKILRKVSSKSLVVMVSHDDEITNNYADIIIHMLDGKIKDVIHQEKEHKDKYLPISKAFYVERKPSIPSSFLIHHTINSIKQKKYRTMICNLVTSLGLIGVGLATSLSSSISSNIKNAYSKIVDDSKITITRKHYDTDIYGRYAASYYEIMDIKDKYKSDIYDVGVTYDNDFESFFPHSNTICLADTTYRTPIEGLTARHINEYRWLDTNKPETIYPEQIETLSDDEVVLSLTIDMVYDICYGLKIERTVTSLSRYLQTSPLRIYFDFRNDNWEYSDEQLLTVIGFTLEKEAGIYHTDHMWNEYMFETRMRFPITDNIEEETSVPWILKKIYYIYLTANNYSFLEKGYSDKELSPFIFEIANKTYFPLLERANMADLHKRILVFSNTLADIPIYYYDLFKDMTGMIENPIFGSSSGYAIYPSSMMYGFANYMYFSSDEDALSETIDINTNTVMNENENLKLPDKVISGHFSESIKGGMNFKNYNYPLQYGRLPNSYDEILISSKLNKSLYEGECLNKELEVAYLYFQNRNSEGELIRKFKTTKVQVCGVIDMDENCIYHNQYWPLLFFQTMLEVSAFDLGVNSIMVDVKNKKEISAVAKKLTIAFPDFQIEEPMKEISKSINTVCSYIEIALMCFSIIAVIISTILLSICNYLYVFENKKDIGLVRCIGLSKKESRKFSLTHSLIMCLISFILSSIELFIISFVISEELSRQSGASFSFSFNTLSLVYMFVLAFFISIASSLFIAHRLNKLDPLTALKQ